MKEEEIVKEYVKMFGKLPPEDAVISYYDDLYQELFKNAIKENKEITPEDLEKTIGNKPYDYESEDEQGEEDMESNKEELKIRKLLKMYGAEDGEIENFMQDLKDFKDDTEDEEDDFNYLDNDTMEKLKATEQGKDLIMNAPKMAKDELKKAIQEYLTNN